MAEAAVRVFAPAKINLFLHVTARRPDGYHELDSLIAFCDVGDEITVSPAETLTLHVSGPFAAALAELPLEQNLALQAARKLGRAFGVEAGARIRLDKRLPVAAGLGGGSADAAAVLKALTALWRLSPAPDALSSLALELGADVPACLHGRAVRMAGIGDLLGDAKGLANWPLLLVYPDAALSTAAVFAAYDDSAAASRGTRPAIEDGADAMAHGGNDLEAAARHLQPAVGTCLSALGDLDSAICARMSGSGSTCFALFPPRSDVAPYVRQIAERHPNWWVYGGKFLP